MISVIVIINDDSEEWITKCISSILLQTYKNFEIICVINSSNPTLSLLKNLEKQNSQIKIIVNNISNDTNVMKNMGLTYSDGDHILFLDSTHTLYENSLEVISEICKKNIFDILIYTPNKQSFNTFKEGELFNTILKHENIESEKLFNYLKYNPQIVFSKNFIDKTKIKFFKESYFEGKNIFFLKTFFASESMIFLENPLIAPLKSTMTLKSDLNMDLFKKLIKNFIKNEKIYNKYKKEFWGYIFGKLFNLIYELRDETTKRNYFKESKLLFDEYYLDKKFYNDIHGSLDNMTLEFFNQTLEEVYYWPKKRDVLRRLINENFGPLTIAIKSPHPIGDHTWGDYFFALALKKSFEKRGFKVVIHELQNWYTEEDNEDIVVVLRGLSKYVPNEEHINVMWNISHPEAISIEEYNSYDITFISSFKHSKEMEKKLDTLVKPLLQCTDPEVFYQKVNEAYSEDILFVGRTRKVFREIIKDVSKTSHDFSVYGGGWEEYIDKKYIKAEFVPNEILNEYYSSCKILLNDHWEKMKELDFPSNRLFDALACGAFIISDNIPSAATLFENNIVTYDNYEDLDEKITFYLNNPNERDKKRKAGQALVLSKHTFDNRANEIIETLKNINF